MQKNTITPIRIRPLTSTVKQQLSTTFSADGGELPKEVFIESEAQTRDGLWAPESFHYKAAGRFSERVSGAFPADSVNFYSSQSDVLKNLHKLQPVVFGAIAVAMMARENGELLEDGRFQAEASGVGAFKSQAHFAPDGEVQSLTLSSSNQNIRYEREDHNEARVISVESQGLIQEYALVQERDEAGNLLTMIHFSEAAKNKA